MQRARSFQFVLMLLSLAATWPSAVAQVVIATVPVGTSPYGVAVNAATNKVYVGNTSCTNLPCPGPGTVTVIDGATNNNTAINAGVYPYSIAVNPVTNKIYVTNDCGNDLNCGSFGTVTVIDGATNSTTTLNMGVYAYAVAVNPATNKIYVVNNCGNDLTCQSLATVTVIDGATNNTTNVTVGAYPVALAVNSVTNQIYVANSCGNDLTCSSDGTVTVIDGATNNTTTVNVGNAPNAVKVNSVTNQIYAANSCGSCNGPGTVTVIDGATNNTATVNVGVYPYSLGIDAVTNKIYVANNCGNDATCSSPGTVAVIDGATNNTTDINVGAFPFGVAVDAVTNQIYVASCGDDFTCDGAGTVTVIDGATNNTVPVAVGANPVGVVVNATTNRVYASNYFSNTVSVIAGVTNPTPLQFVAATPCRLVDTRKSGGPIQGGTSQNFAVPQAGGCNIPDTAAAYSLNVTVVPQGPLAYLSIWPTGEDQPVVSTMNSPDGRIKANAAIVPAGASGAVSVFVTNTTDVVIDIDGYFAPVSDSTLAFYPLPPCRVADTRRANNQGLGAPFLHGQVPRNFPILRSRCGIPNLARAYSFNFTAVPHEPLGYLTVWPAGQTQPLVSTLNALAGTVVANAAIVPAGVGGRIQVFASNDSDLVIDVNGYFAAPAVGGLSLYPAVPCRVIDTRKVGNGQPFSGLLSPPVGVVDSVCAPPSTAQAYVFNATVVPAGSLGYLTLWPDGESQPVASTLNAIDGAITSNMAIVPTTNGSVDAYASGITQLILDISSYFAP